MLSDPRLLLGQAGRLLALQCALVVACGVVGWLGVPLMATASSWAGALSGSWLFRLTTGGGAVDKPRARTLVLLTAYPFGVVSWLVMALASPEVFDALGGLQALAVSSVLAGLPLAGFFGVISYLMLVGQPKAAKDSA